MSASDAACAPGESVDEGLSPSARFPTWSWFEAHTTNRRLSTEAGTGAPHGLPRNVEIAAVVDEDLAVRLVERLDRTEVDVVAVPLAREVRVERVVHVVGPLGGHAEPRRSRGGALADGGDGRGLVEVGLRDEGQRPAELLGESRRPRRKLREEVDGGVVDEGVHRIEPQRVDVEVLEPAQGVVDDEVAHSAAAGLVEVDGPAPRRLVGAREVRSKLREVVSVGPQVVVDDVEAHADALARAPRRRSVAARQGRRRPRGRRRARRRRSPSLCFQGTAATGMSSIISMPRRARSASLLARMASRVPSVVKVPMWSS